MNGEFNTIANDLLPMIYQRWGRVDAVVAELSLPTARAFALIICDASSHGARMEIDIEMIHSNGIFAPAMALELAGIISNIGGLDEFRAQLIASAMPATAELDDDDDHDEWAWNKSRSGRDYH